MAEINCSACQEIRETSPEFVVNGLTDEICASLQNDTGLSATSGNDDCTDLNNLNDCLIGNMETEVDAYDVCDWKEFMKNFIPNLWTVLKAMICAICGIWTNIHNLWDYIAGLGDKINCVYNGLSALANGIGSTVGGQSFVRFYRDNSGTGSGYEWSTTKGASHVLNIYMDANVDNAGSQVADRDYVVLIQNCTDIHSTSNTALAVTYYSSGDTRSIATIRKRQAQHPTIHVTSASVSDFSWTTSGAVLIKKGEYVKVEAHVDSGNAGWFRLHQFILTWIPVNVSSSFDPSSVLPDC